MILSINTSVPEYSVSLSSTEGHIIAEYYSGAKKENFREMAPAVEFLFKATGHQVEGLEAIFVAIGPGKFTGLRVGLSFAKGLAYALQIPIVGVNSLDALAYSIPIFHPKVAVFVDSRRDEWFMGIYEKGSEGLRRKGEIQVVKRKELKGLEREAPLILGHNYPGLAPVIEEELGDSVRLLPPWYWGFRTSGIVSLGLERLRKGEKDDPRVLEPLYLRAPEFRPVSGVLL